MDDSQIVSERNALWGRVRAILLFVGYCALVAIGQIGLQKFALPPLLGFRPELFGVGRIWIEFVYLVAVLIAMALLWRASSRPTEDFALRSAHPMRDLAIGAGTGASAVILSTLVALPFDGSWLKWSGAGSGALATTLGWMALLYLLVAMVEEGMFRGYAQTQLARAIGFYPAALVLGALFVSWHIVRPDAAIDAFIEYALFAAVMIWSVRRSGAIWFAIGMHWAWNVANTWFLGVPDGEKRVEGTLLIAPFPDLNVHVADVIIDIAMTVILIWWLNRLYPEIATRSHNPARR